MDIIIGRAAPVGPLPSKAQPPTAGVVEAIMLNLRPPRRSRGRPPAGQTDRRSGKISNDPASGRVMVVLIPEGHRLPRDIESGNYRIFLRFALRRKG